MGIRYSTEGSTADVEETESGALVSAWEDLCTTGYLSEVETREGNCAMCCSCWKEEGSPIIDNERVRSLQPLIQEVYDYHCAGGNLHIVLDDNNLEDDHLDFCEEEIKKGESHWYGADTPEQAAAERACLVALRAMTFEERVSALGLWDGCWK